MAIHFDQKAQLLLDFINGTHNNVFLTGKAGTGKTTLLRHLIQTTYKKAVVAAPTGIAAINANGVTLHSLFHLPFGTFLPEHNALAAQQENTRINTPKTVLAKLKMSAPKRKLLNELELLVIDEVSMLRADLLDCIDLILRHVRKRRHLPFGGVQVLFIGDLSQLSPVVRYDEQPLLEEFYESPFFFSSRVIQQAALTYIELEHVYRQSDQEFVDLLNRMREKELKVEDVELLNRYYRPNFKPNSEEALIQITTHNRKADTINANALQDLKGTAYAYKAIVEDEYPESMFPIPKEMLLKKGAQVMFIKNDPTGERQYFNGKIGKVVHLNEDEIEVAFEDEGKTVMVEPYTWENKRFKLNEETDEIEDVVIGSFKHYPLRLAWAITVHKSQGLTFDKAILDLNDTFASGQMYVALSRLRSLDGLVLSSPLPSRTIPPNMLLNEFSASKKPDELLQTDLSQARKANLQLLIDDAVQLENLRIKWLAHLSTFDKSTTKATKLQFRDWTNEMLNQIEALIKASSEKRNTLTLLIQQPGFDVNDIQEHFDAMMLELAPKLVQLNADMKQHLATTSVKKNTKTYLKEMEGMANTFYLQLKKLHRAKVFIQRTLEGQTPEMDELQFKLEAPSIKTAAEVADKIPSKLVSYQMFRDGKSVDDIAESRQLVPNTILSHLVEFVEKGEIQPQELMPESKFKALEKALSSLQFESLSEAKSQLSDDYSYGEIRIVMAWQKADS
tara:strand:+ start:2206 stop:4401 length:2196 start_codon:yes stop_codon:yes gene_type:complete